MDGNARSPYPLLPLVPSPALGPALSQCCIRALGGARTRFANPSLPVLAARTAPPGLLSALLFVARPSAGGSAARVGGRARILGKGRDRLVPASLATRPEAEARRSGPRARLTAGGGGLGSGQRS